MQPAQAYKPVRFFLITFLLTWIPWFIAAYFSYQKGGAEYQLFFMLSGLAAPTVSALIMLSGLKNKELRKDFWDRLRLNKIKTTFYPALFLLVPLTVFLATGISLLLGQSVDQFAFSSQFRVMQGHALLSLLLLSLAPIFEELGWRGYGVDSLRYNFNLFTTSLLFAFLWALWHLPLFFMKGYYHHGLFDTNIVYVINFFVSILPVTIVMNWIYYKNGRSIIAAIVFHFMLNIFSELFQTAEFTKCITTVLLLAFSVMLLVKDKALFFTKSIK
jgi:uncharacterized protein